MKRIRPLLQTCKRCGSEFEPLGWKSYLQKYCGKRCAMLARNENAKGHLDKHGYMVLPKGGRDAPQVYEHTRMMEQKIGRRLRKGETVHHINGIRHDNRLENLELWATRHGKGQRLSDLYFHDLTAMPGVFAGALSFGA